MCFSQQEKQNGLLHVHSRLPERRPVSAQLNLPADRVGGHGGAQLGVRVCGSLHALLAALQFHLDGHRSLSPVPAAGKGVQHLLQVLPAEAVSGGMG